MPIVAVIPQPNAQVELREVPEAELEASLPSRKTAGLVTLRESSVNAAGPSPRSTEGRVLKALIDPR